MKFSKQEKQRLKEKYGEWAVVTGASSGIGREIAERLAEAGLNLIINARNLVQLEQIANHLRASYSIEIQIVAKDIADTEGIAEIKALSQNVKVGLLVASAGFGTSGLFIDAKIEDEIKMLRVNCEALLILTHHFSQQFIKHKRGGIILMSSMVGFQGVPYAAHYAATKAYVQSLGEALALELRPYGVDVLAVAPGPVESGFGKQANMKMDLFLKPNQIGIPILKALGRKSTVLPGFLTKFLVYSLRTVPRWGKIRIMQIVMGGMTKHQRE
jgi:uncharacterized protein